MVEIWDVDSILPIGTMLFDLRYLMRQQAVSVTTARLCDVVSHYDISPARLGGDAVWLGSGEGTLPAGRIVAQVEVVVSVVGRRGLVEVPVATHGVPSISGSIGKARALPAERAVSGASSTRRPSAPDASASLRRLRTKVTAHHLTDADPNAARLLRIRGAGAVLDVADVAFAREAAAEPYSVLTRRELQLLRELYDREDLGRMRWVAFSLDGSVERSL